MKTLNPNSRKKLIAARLPRFNINSLDLIRFVRKEVPQSRGIKNRHFASIILKCFHYYLIEEVIDKRDGFLLPEQLGHIFLGTCNRPKNMKTNYKLAYENNGLDIKHENWESDQKLCKIFYTNFSNKYRFHNQELWAFVPLRSFKKRVSVAYREYWKRYIVIEPYKKISYYYKVNNRRLFTSKQVDDMTDYNEFDI